MLLDDDKLTSNSAAYLHANWASRRDYKRAGAALCLCSSSNRIPGQGLASSSERSRILGRPAHPRKARPRPRPRHAHAPHSNEIWIWILALGSSAATAMAAPIPLPRVPIAKEHEPLFRAVNSFVHDYMSQPGHDNSHDYHHILRVLSNAHRLLQAHDDSSLDTSAVYLAALLHDVGDHKYAKRGEDGDTQIANMLRDGGASDALASKVQTLVKHVGYTNEVRNPASVTDVLSRYPELAVVQDADRLDAIGAVGVGRCFAFGAAHGHGRPLAAAIDHFEDKLYKLGGMMKTTAGRDMAVARLKLLRDFADAFQQEVDLSFALE